MVTRYLTLAIENDKVRLFHSHPHPHASRSFVLDDEIVVADSSDDTEFDFKPKGVEPPSITEQIKAGIALKPMGAPPSVTVLSDARFAESFVNQFNALGRRARFAEPAPAEPATPAPSPDEHATPAPAPDVEPSK